MVSQNGGPRTARKENEGVRQRGKVCFEGYALSVRRFLISSFSSTRRASRVLMVSLHSLKSMDSWFILPVSSSFSLPAGDELGRQKKRQTKRQERSTLRHLFCGGSPSPPRSLRSFAAPRASPFLLPGRAGSKHNRESHNKNNNKSRRHSCRDGHHQSLHLSVDRLLLIQQSLHSHLGGLVLQQN